MEMCPLTLSRESLGQYSTQSLDRQSELVLLMIMRMYLLFLVFVLFCFLLLLFYFLVDNHVFYCCFISLYFTRRTDDPLVRDCVKFFTQDWNKIERQ